MENHFSRFSKIILCVLVFILSLSLSLTTVYGQGLQGQSTLQERLAQRGIDLKQLGERVRYAMQVQNRNRALLKKFGVTGMGTGITPEGEAVINVFTASTGITGIPANLEGVSVKTKVTGKFYALRDDSNTCEVSGDSICKSWERWPLPVPIGVSIGHPAISAGTFGARVTDGTDVFVLSNNHVLANINQADINDPILQPGSWDGGVNDDAVANLSDFEPINFCTVFWIWLICDQTNTIDAAIARSTPGEIGFETPTGQYGSGVGYGAPSSIIHAAYGNPNVTGDEDLDLLLGRSVQKYGRTTGNTVGTINTINATVNVCYDDSCSMVARFVDQLIITPGSFSAGGDSGSLIVTNDAQKNPVGLLFAGSDTDTIANRIDLVLDRFGVSVDGEGSMPTLSIDDVNVDEGDAGLTEALFTVSLSVPSENTVTVGYATADGTATSADNDYVPDSGTVNFLPGEVTHTVSVMVSGDEFYEVDEHFYLNIKDPTNALIADSQGEGTILNDDLQPPSLPEITINDVSVNEGNADSTEAVFIVSLSVPSENTVTVGYATADGTATSADNDYVPVSGTVTFLPGEVTHTITVMVTGDTAYEFEETFIVNLTTAENAVIIDHQGEGTILNDDIPSPSSGAQLQTLTVLASTNSWTTVTLDQDYGDEDEMVVVCSPNYDLSGTGPAVVRIRNASGNSFEVGLGRPWYGALPGDHWSTYVHCMVVRAGEYTEAEHGVKMEAVRLTNFTSKDNSRSWVGEPQSYANAYTSPVVVGQVLSSSSEIPGEIGVWSVFWSRGAKATSPPSSSNLYVGRHTGQDPNGRPAETLMYLVIEAGTGEIEGHKYVAGLGGDKIRGMGNNPPFTYNLSGLSSASTAIVSQAGMDGGDGGWPVLYGTSPVSATQLRLAIEEDWYWDSERNHTTEQVGYIVFE